MNEVELAIDWPADQDLLGVCDGFNDRKDLVTLRMCPPTALRGFADDCFGEAGCAFLGSNEDDAILADKSERFIRGSALAHAAQRRR